MPIQHAAYRKRRVLQLRMAIRRAIVCRWTAFAISTIFRVNTIYCNTIQHRLHRMQGSKTRLMESRGTERRAVALNPYQSRYKSSYPGISISLHHTTLSFALFHESMIYIQRHLGCVCCFYTEILVKVHQLLVLEKNLIVLVIVAKFVQSLLQKQEVDYNLLQRCSEIINFIQ